MRAVKVVHKRGLQNAHLDRQHKLSEINIVRQLNHPSILRIYEFFEDARHFYILMEYCSGGELFDKIVHKH